MLVGKGALQCAAWICACGKPQGCGPSRQSDLRSLAVFWHWFLLCASSSLSGGFEEKDSWHQRVMQYIGFVAEWWFLCFVLCGWPGGGADGAKFFGDNARAAVGREE